MRMFICFQDESSITDSTTIFLRTCHIVYVCIKMYQYKNLFKLLRHVINKNEIPANQLNISLGHFKRSTVTALDGDINSISLMNKRQPINIIHCSSAQSLPTRYSISTGFFIKHPKLNFGYTSLRASMFISAADI